jgi:hypothetical protein
VLLILVLVYLGLGPGFHVRWKSALAACREARVAQGEFVEPEVFGNVTEWIRLTLNWLDRLMISRNVPRVRAWARAHPEVRLLAGHMWRSFFEAVDGAQRRLANRAT